MIARVLLCLAAIAAAACDGRRDVAVLAANQAPFDALRGLPFETMRSGGVRAFRRHAVALPDSGLREQIGPFTVTYLVPVFDTTGGAWPVEDALVLEIIAERVWTRDEEGTAAWDAQVDELRTATGSPPICVMPSEGIHAPVEDTRTPRTVVFDRGARTFLSVEFVPADTLVGAARTRLRLSRHPLCPSDGP